MGVEHSPEYSIHGRMDTEPRLSREEPQFAIAMAAMLGPKTAYLPFCEVGTYRHIGECAGAKLDFWPVQPTPSLQVAWGRLFWEDRAAIVSASGSFRSERSLQDAWRHPNRALAVAGYFLFPHRDNYNTVDLLTRQIRRHDGRRLPVVQYPETSREIRDEILTPRLVQPTPEEFIRQRVKSAEDLDRYLTTNGFDGFCFDTLHSRFLFTDLTFRHLFREVIKRTKLVHLSLGRTDAQRQGYPVDNKKDLTDVLSAPINQNSQISRLLREIRDTGFNSFYVLEVTADSLSEATHHKSRLLRPEQVGSLYLMLHSSADHILSR